MPITVIIDITVSTIKPLLALIGSTNKSTNYLLSTVDVSDDGLDPRETGLGQWACLSSSVHQSAP